jgi:hypothetical protein
MGHARRQTSVNDPRSLAGLRPTICQTAAAHPYTTIFAVALAMRLVNLALLSGDDAYFAESDTNIYWQANRSSDVWGNIKGIFLATDRMPLYLLLVEVLRAMFGDHPLVVVLLQTMIDAGTCVVIAALGRLLSPVVGLLAGTLAAVSPNLIINSTQILTDTVFLFFFSLMLLACTRFLIKPSLALAAMAGLAGGLALMTRPSVQFLLLAAVPTVFFVALVHSRRLGFAAAATLCFTIVAAAPVAPVLLRNAIQYGVLGLTTQGGEHLAYWIAPLVRQRADGTQYHITVERLNDEHERRLASRTAAMQTTDPFQSSRIKTEIAREEMANLPTSAFIRAWIEGIAINLASPALVHDPRVRALPKPSFYGTGGATLWQKARAYLFESPGLYQFLVLAGLLASVPLLILQAVGFFLLARTYPWAAFFAGGVVVYFLLIGGPVATPRYRMPMEPILIVLTSIALYGLFAARLGGWITRGGKPDRMAE